MTLPHSKATQVLSIEEISGPAGSDRALAEGTDADVCDMHRMGKKQVLRRDFRFISIVGFVCILQSTWESALMANQYGLLNGGTAGVIWVTIAVWLCAMCMIASIAEMASMAPTAGGQYHWVSEFAPTSLEKPLSYVVGWCCCLGWVASIPSGGQFLAYLVEGLVLLVHPDANIGALWQTTLMLFLFVCLTVAFNMFASHQLPLAEGIIFVLHVVGFFVFLIVFWVMADKAPAHDVFFQFSNGGGWPSIGVSCLVGLTTPLWMFIGPDCGAHMSEELKDAGLVLPKAMVWATFINGIMGITMLITFCFCVGDLDGVLNSPTGIPIIQLTYNVTGSIPGTVVLTTLLIVLSFFGTITCIASASRQAWAFARDQGFPFSTWLTYVRPGVDVPINSLIMCLGVSLVLGAINFGSDTALNAIIAVSNAALVFSYIISIGCLRLKRLRGEPLLPRRWSLGRFGGLVNDIALAFLLISFVFSFFPEEVHPDAPSMNWAIVMFGATCILALGYYVVGGGQKYVNPVMLVRKEE